MSAPERIYRSETRSPTHVIYYGEDRRAGENIAYIRADIHKEAKAEIDALKAELALAKELLDRWYNDSDIPDSNCSCHISPPCGDCVNWGGLRETASETKKLLGVPQ